MRDDDYIQMEYLSQWRCRKETKKTNLSFYGNEVRMDFKILFRHIRQYLVTLIRR